MHGNSQDSLSARAQWPNCGACLTAGESEMEVESITPGGATVGDHVSFSLSTKRVVQAACWCTRCRGGVACRLCLGSAADFGTLRARFGVPPRNGFLILRLVEKKGKRRSYGEHRRRAEPASRFAGRRMTPALTATIGNYNRPRLCVADRAAKRNRGGNVYDIGFVIHSASY